MKHPPTHLRFTHNMIYVHLRFTHNVIYVRTCTARCRLPTGAPSRRLLRTPDTARLRGQMGPKKGLNRAVGLEVEQGVGGPGYRDTVGQRVQGAGGKEDRGTAAVVQWQGDSGCVYSP